MIGVALIGHGYWGSILERYLKADSNFELKYVCDSKSNLQEVWNDDSVKAVVVATRNEQRYPILKQALDSGKHILTEKPLTLTIEEARGLLVNDLYSNEQVLVDYTFTVSESLRLACREVRKGRIGELVGFDINVNHLGPFGGGNVYWILGSHALSVLSMFVPLETLFYHKQDIVPNETGVILVTGEIKGQIHLSLNYPNKTAEFVFYGTDGTIVYNPNQKDTLIIETYERKTWAKGNDIPHKRETYQFDEANNIKHILEYFRAVIEEGIGTNLDVAVKITEILERIQK